MAALTTTTLQGTGQRTMTPNTLTSSDTFAYEMGKEMVLVLYNPTGSTITPTLTGDSLTSRALPGGATGTLASGITSGGVSVAANAIRWLTLDEMYLWLGATNTITGGTGLLAYLMTM